MAGGGDVAALAGGVMTPTDLNELAGGDDRVVLDRGAAKAPMPVVDVEPPPREVFVKDCDSATIVDETRASAAATRDIR